MKPITSQFVSPAKSLINPFIFGDLYANREQANSTDRTLIQPNFIKLIDMICLGLL